jgi:hypothetical protein
MEMPAGSDLQATLGSPQAYAQELVNSGAVPELRGFRARLRRVPLVWKIAVPLVVALAVAGTVTGIWLSADEPLERGGWSFAPGIQPDLDFGDQANVIVDYQHDARYSFGFSLINDGRLPIEIVDFPLASYATEPFVVEQVLVDPPQEFGGSDAAPFRPFTLQPGEERGFTFRGVLAHCDAWDHGGGLVLESVKVQYRVLWITKSRDISLPRPIMIRMPGSDTSQCPYPHPPRQGPPNGNGTQILGVEHGGWSVEVQVIASRAPTGALRNADWSVVPGCNDVPPAGFTAVPVDIVFSRWPDPFGRGYSPVPVDVRFALADTSTGGRVVVAAAGSSPHCRTADPVHIETLDEGDITATPAVVEVPTGTCGAQQVEVSVREEDGWHGAGTARLDVPC